MSRVTPAGAWSRRTSASRRVIEAARRVPTRTATRGWDMGGSCGGRGGKSQGQNGLRSGFIPDEVARLSGLDHVHRTPTVAPMSQRPLLPLLGDAAPERRDAARNREALLVAAEALIGRCGIEGVTMDAVAARAGV